MIGSVFSVPFEADEICSRCSCISVRNLQLTDYRNMLNVSTDTADDIGSEEQFDTEEGLTESSDSESESDTEQAFTESSCYAICKCMHTADLLLYCIFVLVLYICTLSCDIS